MDASDSGDFTRRLIGLGELFDADLSPVKQALYFEALRDLPLGVVVRALNQAAKVCKFFPKPAELRTLAVGDTADQAETAWMAFRQAMKHAGAYTSLAVDDAALAGAIVAMFGTWPLACAADYSPEMWAAKRKEFDRVYRVLRNRKLAGARYLPGICEEQNRGRPEWMGYVPVQRLDATGGLEALTLAEAEEARTQIAAQAHGFSRLQSSAPPAQPVDRGDTA